MAEVDLTTGKTCYDDRKWRKDNTGTKRQYLLCKPDHRPLCQIVLARRPTLLRLAAHSTHPFAYLDDRLAVSAWQPLDFSVEAQATEAEYWESKFVQCTMPRLCMISTSCSMHTAMRPMSPYVYAVLSVSAVSNPLWSSPP